MIDILIVSSETDSLSGLVQALKKDADVKLDLAESGEKALEMISGNRFALVVTDETLKDMGGLHFVEKVIRVNPMINFAAVSHLTPEAFHEASEGLGILMQIPVRPGKEHAEQLLVCLRKVMNLTTGH